MENSDRAKFREGDSPRAQVYRLKDKLLTFSYDQLQKHCAEHDLQETIQAKFGTINEHLRVLHSDENNKESADAASTALQDVHNLLKETGFQFPSE